MQEMMAAIPDDVSLDAFSQYRRWVDWTPTLSAEEEHALFARLAQGPNEDAETRLVAGYQTLVQHIARRFRPAAALVQYDSLDVIQEGNIGLLDALRDYAKEQPCPFRTFAGGYIELAIVNALRKGGRVHMSAKKRAEVNKLRRVVEGLTSSTGEMPTAEQVAQVVGKSVQGVREMFDFLYLDRFVSLHAFSDGDNGEREYDVPACPLVLADSERQVTVWQNAIERAFEVLSEKQRLVLRLRYGLDGHRLLAAEIARLWNVQEKAVEALEYAALKKLARLYPDPVALLVPPPTDYYTPADAAALLGVVVASLHSLAARGLVQAFPARSVGFLYGRASCRDVCFLKSEIDALAAARRSESEVA